MNQTKIFCPFCNKECNEESLPSVIGFSMHNAKDYICNNPLCKHFGEVVTV